MKRYLYGLLVALLCLGLWLAAKRGMQHVLAQTDRNVRPYVAEVIHYYIDPKDGHEVVKVDETVGRARSGAMVHAGTRYHDGKAYTGLRRIDMPDGFAALVIDSIKAKSSGHEPGDSKRAGMKMAMQETTPVDCSGLGYVTDGEESIAGQRTVRIIGNIDDTNRVILWRLPDYNCDNLQTTRQQRASTSAPWQTVYGSRLLKFAEIDPDPALFSGFASYSEMPPSAIHKAWTDHEGIPMKECKTCKDSDKAYADWNK